jgi:steroid delta-isomerase
MAVSSVPAAVSGYFRALRDNSPSAFAGVFAPEGISHDPAGSEPLVGRTAIHDMLAGFLPTWGRFDGITEDEVFSSGNAVSVRWTGHGVSSSGSSVDWTGINTFFLDGGGLIETLYAVFDADDMNRQLNA